MMKPLKIGVLGCASIAERYVLPALQELAEYEIFGIASRNKEKANSFAETFNTTAYYSYESIVEDQDIDAVYIPLPNSLHYDWVKKSLLSNKHVLVEKSMACHYDEVVELNELAKSKGLALVENFQFKCHSQLAYIKDLISKGTLGDIRQVRSAFGFPPFPDSDNIRYDESLGGGALLDAGAYPLKISQLLLGDDLEIATASLTTPDDYNVDIWGSATLQQKSTKITSQVAFGFDHYYQNAIEIWGTKGKLSTNRIFTAPPGFEPTLTLETAQGQETITLPSDHHFKKMLQHFYNVAINKINLEVEYAQNVNQARLIQELKQKSNVS